MPAHVRDASGKSAVRHGPVSTVVGVVGELLITAGVVLGLFVVWQLWWTDIEANQEHAQIVASLDFVAPPAPTTVAVPGEGDPPVMDPPPVRTTFATLFIPRFGADYVQPISQGIEKREVLDTLGIGHYPDTQMPGELGNFAIAGHRTTYGKPLNKIADLKAGDAIVVRTADTWYVYEMKSNQIVMPQDYNVVYPIPGADSPDVIPDNRYITLTACHPMYSAKERFIVHGTLKYWAPVSSGVPQELIDAGIQVTALGADGSSTTGAR